MIFNLWQPVPSSFPSSNAQHRIQVSFVLFFFFFQKVGKDFLPDFPHSLRSISFYLLTFLPKSVCVCVCVCVCVYLYRDPVYYNACICAISKQLLLQYSYYVQLRFLVIQAQVVAVHFITISFHESLLSFYNIIHVAAPRAYGSSQAMGRIGVVSHRPAPQPLQLGI